MIRQSVRARWSALVITALAACLLWAVPLSGGLRGVSLNPGGVAHASALSSMRTAAVPVNSWTSFPPLPVAVQEAGATTVGNLIYTVGGTTGSGLTNSVWAYNTTTGLWSAANAIAPLPGPARDHIGVAAVNGKVYAIGGLTSWPAPSVPYVYQYDPASNTWTRMADMPDPRPRGGVSNMGRGAMGVSVINGLIYCAGGSNGTSGTDAVAVRAFASFNPATNSWTTLPNMPTARDHLTGAALNGKFYAIGGRNIQITAVTAANQVYDPAKGKWSNAASLPVARGGLASGVLNNKIVVFGGEGNGPSNGTWPNTEQYDPSLNTWTELTQMITSRHGLNGVVFNGVIYAPGGGTYQGGGHPSTADEVFAYSTTVTPPPTPTPVPAPTAPRTVLLDFAGTDGGIANTGFTTVLPGTNPANTSLLTLNTVSTSTLTINSTGGDTYPTSAPAADNALAIPLDGGTVPYTISARLLGPIALGANYQGGGIVLGLDAGRNVRLKMNYNAVNGAPGIEFSLTDPSLGFTNNVNNSNPAVSPAAIQTLDLFLSADPVAHTVTASYRLNSSNPANIVPITTTAWPAGYFVNPLYGGLITTNYGSSTSVPFTYDWFQLNS